MALSPVQATIFIILTSYILHKFLSSVLLFLQRRRVRTQAGCEEPPTSGTWPFGLDVMRGAKDAFAGGTYPLFFDECFGKYGRTWRRRTESKLYTVDLNVVKLLLSTHFETFLSGAEFKNSVGPLFGSTGIFTVDGARWEHARALLRPQFSRDQTTDYKMLEKHVRRLLRRIFIAGGERTVTLDLQPLFFSLMLDTSTEFLMGESAGSLREVEGEKNKKDGERAGKKKKEMDLAEAFTFGQQVCAVRLGMGPVGSYVIFGRDAYTKFHEACRICRAWADHYVDRALSSRSEPSVEEDKKKYVVLNEVAKLTQNKEILRDQCINLLAAGRDTTASLLSWTIYSLSRHPDVFARLREEVLGIFGTDEVPTHTKLKSATYLSWVLKEVLRLFPPVPFDGRSAAKDIVLPVGGGPDGSKPLFMRKGQQIRYSIFSIHRRKDLYGEDADEFRPERWGENPKLVNGTIGWGYIPFNGGPRICMGQQHALNTASYTIIRLLQTCSAISLPHDVSADEKPKYGLGVALFCMDGLRVRMTRAEGNSLGGI